MILPFPQDPQGWSFRPVTWSLVLVNFFIFFVFFFGNSEMNSSSVLTDADLRTAGEVYVQYLQQLPPEVRDQQPAWVLKMRSGHGDQMDYLGSYAVRDRTFMDLVASGFGVGDETALLRLQTDLANFRDKLASQPLHRFGLSSERTHSLAWLTYQFSHVGLIHLLSNLAFLFVIGLVIEGMIGAIGLLGLYLGGGIAGGLLFLYMSPHGVIPMVGASGAVSALMAFYALFEPRRNIRYFYFVAPIPGLHGLIFLPVLLILPLFLVADINGLISAPAGLVSGVAYAAHVGGALFGFFWAAVLRFVFKIKPLADQLHVASPETIVPSGDKSS